MDYESACISIFVDNCDAVWKNVGVNNLTKFVKKMAQYFNDDDFVSIMAGATHYLLELGMKLKEQLALADCHLVMGTLMVLAYKYCSDFTRKIKDWSAAFKLFESNMRYMEVDIWKTLDYNLTIPNNFFSVFLDEIDAVSVSVPLTLKPLSESYGVTSTNSNKSSPESSLSLYM